MLSAESICRGAPTLPTHAVEAGVAARIDDHAHVTDEHGHHQFAVIGLCSLNVGFAVMIVDEVVGT